MQSNQFNSDTIKPKLNLNNEIWGNNSIYKYYQSDNVLPTDSSLIDSLNVNYIAPDSVIVFGYKPEWSQFRKEYTPEFNYKTELIDPIPYDSLHTVLKGVEVVFSGKKFIRNNPDWLVGVIVLSFILIATVRLIFNKYLNQLIQSTINYSAFSRMYRERFFNFLHASFRLDIVFYLSFSLFFYQILSSLKIDLGINNSALFYLTCIGLVILYYFVKRIIYLILGVITESTQEVKEYLFSITVYNRVLGLIILPVTTIIAFLRLNNTEPLSYAGLVIIAIFYILSLARGSKIFLKKHFSILYLILYLCTLEILPLLIIYNLLLM